MTISFFLFQPDILPSNHRVVVSKHFAMLSQQLLRDARQAIENPKPEEIMEIKNKLQINLTKILCRNCKSNLHTRYIVRKNYVLMEMMLFT